MCGIIGYVGNRDAAPIIIEGLRKLEYRGYDSAGIALCGSEGINVVKREGRLSVLEKVLESSAVAGNTGIGHTRWATHGEPSDINSHPHVGGLERIAVVHNGIIENYKALRDRLKTKGVKFVSDTDSEVIAQLAEYYYNGDMLATVAKLINALEGSYALGIMCSSEPDKIVAVRKDNPLIIGLSGEGNFLASDVPAILNHTSTVCYLEEHEIAVLSCGSVEFFNSDLEKIEKQTETITWSAESAEKGGYEHFMFKEIMEQPRVLSDTISSALIEGQNCDVLKGIDIRGYDRLVITACGSAYNAGMVAKYMFERLCRMPVEVDIASEFRYKDPVIDENTLVIVISQSGETADSIGAMREAKRRGACTLAIVNVVGSTIAKEADHTVFTLAGPEIAVATTKAFSSQLALLYILAAHFAAQLGRISPDERQELEDGIRALPDMVGKMLSNVDRVQCYAATCFNSKSIFFIGRNVDYAIALEGSLKLKEISYIHSEAYAGGELKHGTISLIEDNTLVVAISCCKGLYGKTLSNVEQVVSRGAKVLLITDSDSAEETDRIEVIRPITTFTSTRSANSARLNELLSPSLSVIILQLLSYYVAANKGLDIDKPRNLAKSVTIE
ncbi:MAG: glutamine--fructose-6-phosphate transaminase (isomerizing) [Oscillospiraceae bacterium]|nr:glutamine--fructose-6-phosphate transaminase (isomerizing) [Oscillospiraceae bacterium]